MYQQDWKKYWNNPNTRQYVLNYFWNHIGFEQYTNRAIFHDGTMKNVQYLNDWKFFYQNNQNRYLFDRQNMRLYDTNLNYYDGKGYYTLDHRLIEDAYEDYIYKLKDKFKERHKLFMSFIDTDPLYKNGKFKDPINTTYSDYFTNYNSANTYKTKTKNKNIFKNYQKNNNSYTVNNDEVFKRKFSNTQQTSNKTQQPKQNLKQNTEFTTKENIKKIINQDPILGNGKAKEPISYIKNRNYQQEAVDKLIAEFNKESVELENVKTSTKKPDNMVRKQLTEKTSHEKLFSPQKVDTKGHSMTKAVDNYNNILKASTVSKTDINITRSTRSNIYKSVRNVDAPTVGKIITGVIDDNINDLAAKVAADFSQFRYGKVISKLF